MPKYKVLDINDFEALNNEKYKKEYENGVFKLELDSWDKFHNIVKIFNNNTDYIWRGQRCYPEEIKGSSGDKDWTLKATFDRRFPKKNREIKLNEILNTFKKRIEDLPNTYDLDFSKDFEIWAIGQHHGLSTPLLDWTKIPYFAAYFAFYKKGKEQTEHRVVYALNRTVKRLMVKEKDIKTKELLSTQRKIDGFDYDIGHFSPEHHKRFKAQKGAFTKAYKGCDVKSIVKEFWEKDDRENKNYTNKIILTEILISDKFHDEILNSLKSMNITHGVLFPDYAGAVDICKIDLKRNEK